MQVLPNLRLHDIKGISIAQRVSRQSIPTGLMFTAVLGGYGVFGMHMALFQWGDCAFLIKSIATRHNPEPTHIPFRLVVNAAQGINRS